MFRMRGGKVDGYDYCAGFMCVFVVDESGKKCTNLDLGDEVWMNRFRLGNNKVYGERFRCK
jgi:NADPH:quinone reductase-like Zn-dependent oxidoreductase